VPSSGGHPDPGLLAAHAERRLVGAEAAQLEAHLADCSICCETFAETVEFLLTEEPAEEPVPNPARVLPFHRRPAFQIGVGLAAAAGLVLAVLNFGRSRPQPGSSPLVAELAQAMGTTRFIEPRVTGGFQHGRLVILRSGDTTQGLDAHSPAVIAAVAHIRERAQGDTSPEALGAVAVTYLVSGDVGGAVKALESATAQDPKNAKLQSDLAAAYLVRASRLDEPSDIPKALEAAEKSIEQKDAPVEAWFNRALALESLHLTDSAKRAWEDYLARDSTSAWADEARKHIEELPHARESANEDQARTRAALAQGAAAIDALADEAPSILADYFLAELLPTWADACLSGNPNAAVLKAQAGQIGAALFRTTGDALPRDTAVALSLPANGGSRDPPRAQALGYKALLEAQRLNDLGKPSCEPFRHSGRLLREGGSPFEARARERVILTCLFPGKDKAVLPELSHLEDAARTRQYGSVLGRALWMKGLYYSDNGDYDRALHYYRLARDTYHTLRDAENEASVLVRMAYVLNASGDTRAAWRERVRTLALLDANTRATRREDALFLAAVVCWLEQHARAAVPFLNELVDSVRRRGSTQRLAFSLVWRADVFHALGQGERAAADLAAARSILGQAAGAMAYQDQVSATADAAEGRILAISEPARALSCVRRAIPYFEANISAFAPALHLQAARLLRARGSATEAQAELEAAIRQIESQRTLMSGTQQQAIFFEYAASMPFDEMVSLQLDVRDDPIRALRYVERSRGRQLTASLLRLSEEKASRTSSRRRFDPAPDALGALQRRLSAGVALVYYVLLPDRLVAWVLDHESVRFFPLSVSPEDLERRVIAYDVAIEGGAPVSALREQGARLLDELVRPLRPALVEHHSLVLIPDAFLQQLSFASLWDRQTGRHLVEDYRLAQSPNGTVFVEASAAAARPSRRGNPHLLAVGNPRLVPGSGLPELRGARIEATEISRLYPDSDVLLDAAATKRAFLAGLDRSDVVHFAGHATEGDSPGSERLVLAVDRETGTGGDLRADEIASSQLKRARLIVLAGCRTAPGLRSHLEGVFGMSRPFLEAGVPMVVASLWDVDDSASRRFFLEFHRRFLAGGDAATAVRAAQVAFLRGDDPAMAHPSKWAGFVSLGGLALGGAVRVRNSPAL
jgi:CHAT domain-containing protein